MLIPSALFIEVRDLMYVCVCARVHAHACTQIWFQDSRVAEYFYKHWRLWLSM